MGEALPKFVRMIRPVAQYFYGRKFTAKLQAQGYGLNTREENFKLAKDILKVLSVCLGTKPYLAGSVLCFRFFLKIKKFFKIQKYSSKIFTNVKKINLN
jgi:hypothetical protein